MVFLQQVDPRLVNTQKPDTPSQKFLLLNLSLQLICKQAQTKK